MRIRAADSFGTKLLAAQEPHSNQELTYLTTVTAAAHARMGQLQQARGLLQAQWARFDHSGEYDPPLRELDVLTRPGKPGAVAQAGGGHVAKAVD